MTPAPRRLTVVMALGLVLGLLSACGLRPLHGQAGGEKVNASLAAIEIIVPPGRSGVLLLTAMQRSLNPAQLNPPKAFQLVLALERESEALAIQLDDTETRFDLIIEARYSLQDIAADATLLNGAATQVSSYNVVREPFATLVSEQDSERRAMQAIAAQIRNQLALYFVRQGA